MAGRPGGATARPDRVTLSVFALVVVFGGSNFVAVSINVEEMAPFWGAGVRFSSAAVLLGAFMVLRRVPVPRGRALAPVLAFGVLNFAAFYALMYWALQDVPAGMASVVIAAAPLLTMFLVVAHGLERFRLRGLLGALLAIAGIAVMYARGAGSGLDTVRLLAVVAAAACVAEAAVVAKGYVRSGPIATNAVGMAVGAVLLLLVSSLVGEDWSLPARTETWLSLGYLVVVGSVALFIGLLFVLERWTASATSFVTVLFPIVAVVLDALLGRQGITLPVVAGGLLVLAGVWLGALAPARSAAVRVAVEPAD